MLLGRLRSGQAAARPRSSSSRRCAQLPELRAPRIAGDLQRPEITITPRLDLAADLGVTTAALSQAIRIATQGEIDQNSARFSLSDRQMPIRVALDRGSRRNLSTIENMPVPTATGGSVPLKVVAEISFGAGPTDDPAHQPGAPDHDRRRSRARASVNGEAMAKIRAAADHAEPARRASSERRSGQQRDGRRELISELPRSR